MEEAIKPIRPSSHPRDKASKAEPRIFPNNLNKEKITRQSTTYEIRLSQTGDKSILLDRKEESVETNKRAIGNVNTYPITLKAKRENPIANPAIALISTTETRIMSKIPKDTDPIKIVQSIVSF